MASQRLGWVSHRGVGGRIRCGHVPTRPRQQARSGSTALDVMANERACASGEAPIEREVISIVVETEDYIDITILVEESSGSQDCPSNPDFPLTIDLDEPIGNRTVRDLGLQPAEARTGLHLRPRAPSLETRNRLASADAH